MSAQPNPYLTPEEYLEIERKAEYKSEYLNGRMWPLGGTPHGMAGGKPYHSIIAGNVVAALHGPLKGRCIVYTSDMRLRVSEQGLYTYPDIAVVCGKPAYALGDLLTNPTVLIEVLSPTTERNDRGIKFQQYQTIQSLQEYVLISQSEPRVEQFRRTVEGFWTYSSRAGLEATMKLESVACAISLSEVYLNVEFEPAPQRLVDGI